MLLTRAVGTVPGRNENLATAEEVGVDGVGARAKKAERDSGCHANDRGGAIEARQHRCAGWNEHNKGIAHTDKRAADRREEADCQRDATDDPRGREGRAEEVSLRRRNGEPRLHGHGDAESSAQQQEAEARPVAWIVKNVPAPLRCVSRWPRHTPMLAAVMVSGVTRASGPDVTRSGDPAPRQAVRP